MSGNPDIIQESSDKIWNFMISHGRSLESVIFSLESLEFIGIENNQPIMPMCLSIMLFGIRLNLNFVKCIKNSCQPLSSCCVSNFYRSVLMQKHASRLKCK